MYLGLEDCAAARDRVVRHRLPGVGWHGTGVPDHRELYNHIADRATVVPLEEGRGGCFSVWGLGVWGLARGRGEEKRGREEGEGRRELSTVTHPP